MSANPPEIPFILPSLTPWRKSRLLRYAEQVLITQQQMQTTSGKNIIHYTLKKKRRHIRMNHYPKGDRMDLKTGGQYFYHCHREDEASSEHGHFHCFLRYTHIPKYLKPKPLPDWDKNLKNPYAHLIAISMNRCGQPIRLFTVNRWVTDETWYDAKHLPTLINRFKMTLTDDPHWQILDQWIEGMLHLFAPQIAWLHHQRDAAMKAYDQKNTDDNPYENNSIEELSEIAIDLKEQVQWIITSP